MDFRTNRSFLLWIFVLCALALVSLVVNINDKAWVVERNPLTFVYPVGILAIAAVLEYGRRRLYPATATSWPERREKSRG